MMEFILDRCDDGDYSIRGYPTSVVLKSEGSYGYGVCQLFIADLFALPISRLPKIIRVKVSRTWRPGRSGWLRASLRPNQLCTESYHYRGTIRIGSMDNMHMFRTPLRIIQCLRYGEGKLGDVFYLKFEEVKS